MQRDRYRALIDQLQYAGRRELIYGLHVHVAVDDPDRAIRIVNALRAHLCELVALSANSPFWRGEPTGFASCRHLIFSAFPRSGPPPHFRDYAEYADVDRRARRGRLHRGLHADLVGRAAAPAVRHGRGARDGRGHAASTTRSRSPPTSRRSCAATTTRMAALCHPVLAHENKWRAARYGLDGTVVDVVARRPGADPRPSIARTLTELAPYARELGCERELDGDRPDPARGQRCRRQLAAGGDARAAARVIANLKGQTL